MYVPRVTIKEQRFTWHANTNKFPGRMVCNILKKWKVYIRQPHLNFFFHFWIRSWIACIFANISLIFQISISAGVIHFYGEMIMANMCKPSFRINIDNLNLINFLRLDIIMLWFSNKWALRCKPFCRIQMKWGKH